MQGAMHTYVLYICGVNDSLKRKVLEPLEMPRAKRTKQTNNKKQICRVLILLTQITSLNNSSRLYEWQPQKLLYSSFSEKKEKDGTWKL